VLNICCFLLESVEKSAPLLRTRRGGGRIKKDGEIGDWRLEIRAALFVSSQVMKASGFDTLMVRDRSRSFGASLMVQSFCKAAAKQGRFRLPTSNLLGYGKRCIVGNT
jgi:hypothetical protein